MGALDYPLLAAVVVLYFIGVATIYSAAGGMSGKGLFFAGRQLLWGAVAVPVLALVLFTDYEPFIKHAVPVYALACFSLVLLFILGHRAKGAQSWIRLGFFSIQPAEFVKIALALVLSRRLTEHPPVDLKNFILALALGGISAFLVLVQPDLGSTLVYLAMIFTALLVSGARKRYLVSLTGMGVAALPVFWLMLKEYQKKRILVFINPELDPLGAGYNVIQSRIAVGSGRFFGKGYMVGTQSKLKFLPEPHTDFIFSVFAEEFGLLGSMILLALFGFIFWRMLRAALLSRSVSTKVLVSSLTVSLWFHSVESIGMSMGLLPVTGLPLPLMSYGGSSLLTTLISIGIVLRLGALDELELRETAVCDNSPRFTHRP